MSDEELFHSFQGAQNKIGQSCYVQIGSEDNACQYYVKARPSNVSNDNGWPRTPISDGDKGTGCVGTSKSCYFLDTAYNLTESERDSFCTSNTVSNAAAQLRHAIQHHACDFQIVSNDQSSTLAVSPEISIDTALSKSYANETVEKDSSHPPPTKEQDANNHKSWWNKATSTVSGWFGRSHKTKTRGGGRDWLVNAQNRTIMAKHDPSFFLGYGPSPLILVRRESDKKLIFPNVATNETWANFSAVQSNDKKTSAKLKAIGFIPQSDVQKVDDYKYYDTLAHPSFVPFSIRYQDSNFIVNKNGFALDVAFWNITEGNKVNFFKPVNDDSTVFVKGGGRDWTWNDDGTIASKLNPDLVLGLGDTGLMITHIEEDAVRLTQAQDLANGKSAVMNLLPQYNNGPSQFVRTLDEKTHDGWRYRNAIVQRQQEGNPFSAVEIKYDGNFILTLDESYVLDISSWKMEPWTSVNFVGGDE